jgi:hypothetical protein
VGDALSRVCDHWLSARAATKQDDARDERPEQKEQQRDDAKLAYRKPALTASAAAVTAANMPIKRGRTCQRSAMTATAAQQTAIG